MAAHQVTDPLQKERLTALHESISSLNSTVTTIEEQLKKSGSFLSDTVSAKIHLQTKLAHTESRLKAALDDLAIQKRSSLDAISLAEHATRLQREVRSKRGRLRPSLCAFCYLDETLTFLAWSSFSRTRTCRRRTLCSSTMRTMLLNSWLLRNASFPRRTKRKPLCRGHTSLNSNATNLKSTNSSRRRHKQLYKITFKLGKALSLVPRCT